MEVKASLKYLRISPRKTRLVVDLIKGLSAKEAEKQLIHLPKRSSQSVLKLLKSAIANAESNFQLSKDNLYVKSARVDEGPALKRWRPRARGAAYVIKKRTSHVFIILDEIKEKIQAKTKLKKIEKEEKIIKSQKKKQETEKKGIKTLKAKKPHFKKAETELGKKVSGGVAPKKKVFRRKAI